MKKTVKPIPPLQAKAKTDDVIQPYMVEMATAATQSTTTVRRDVAGNIPRSDRYRNIEDGLVPYRNSSTIYGPDTSTVDVRDAVILCQKAYYNFALFRNIIDLMTEFSVTDIYYRGGSKQSRDFFKALFNKINLWDLQDKFYREYYRSGNVFIYRFDATIQPEDVKKITQIFAAKDADEKVFQYNKPKKNVQDVYYSTPEDRTMPPFPDPGHPQTVIIDQMTVPARYIILNPADIQMMSTLNFAYGLYFKILTDYEVARLRHPKTPEDIAVYNSLPPAAQQQVHAGARIIAVPLDQDRVSMIFYKRQDYEPFAVPMGFPVLEDINFKYEMRKIDMAICRTMQQMVLLVTCGAKPEEGGVNQKNLDALKNLFKNNSVGRVLVSDYTTKASFVIPDIGELLNPQKYEIVNADINIGLNNVFAGSEKFANQSQKVDLFIARLEQGRQNFLHNFLMPEIKRIAKCLNFKNFPTAYYEDIKLKDNTNLQKLFARLIEMGVLTPEQGFQAVDKGVIPDPTTFIEEQQEFKKQRDSGLFVPLLQPKQQGQGPQNSGRPAGTTAPQTTKTISPIGSKASIESTKFSLTKIKDNMLIAQELEESVTAELKEIHSIKRMSKAQKQIASDITNQIIANEQPSKWLKVVKDYTVNPVDKNPERVKEMITIASEHQLDNDYLAGILLASKVENVQTG